MRQLIIFITLLILPAIAEAQIELGFDVGLTVDKSAGITHNSYDIPAKYLRIGFPRGRVSFESLVAINHQRIGRSHLTIVEVLPGIMYQLNRYYVRGEVAMLLVSSNFDRSSSQFGYGVAVGSRRALRGPVFLRLETGITKWAGNVDYFGRSVFRALVGLSVVVGS